MSLILSGSDGVSDIDGTASTPAIRGTDANTGIFFPAADTIAFAEGGTESMRLDSSGNVLVGTTTALYSSSGRGLIELNGSTNSLLALKRNNASDFYIHNNSGSVDIYNNTNTPMAFATNGTERMRITSGGDLLVGTTSAIGSATGILQVRGKASENAMQVQIGTNGNNGILWYNASGSAIGSIVVNSGGVAYNTTSDYRLKENIAPMTGALNKVQQLKPVTYTWKETGEQTQGFIAHELQAIVPECVTGEKDAVDAKGNPVYQGIDTSFLVATLTAALQELNAKVEAQAAKIAELEAK